MGKKYNLREYAFSKEIIEEFPKFIYLFNRSIRVLEKHRKYYAVDHVYQAMKESLNLMKIQLEAHKEKFETKGLVEDGKEIK